MRAPTFKAALVPALFVAVPLTLACGPDDQGQPGGGDQPGMEGQQPGGAGQPGGAEQPGGAGQPGQPGGEQPSADVSDDDLETMAEVYVEMQDLQSETDAMSQEATSPEEQNELQAQATEDMQAILDDHGMSVEEYQQMVQLLNTDEEVRERFEEVLAEIDG